MKKKVTIIGIAAIVFFIAYLFAAHHYIYKTIRAAGLEASDITHEYSIGSGADNEGRVVYTALGDSLTAGVGVLKYEESYPYRLAQMMAEDGRTIDLRVQAYPGARTNDLIKDLLAPAISNQPDIITLVIGVNDIHGFVPKEKFAENYQLILKRLKTGTKAKIYAISIPYIGTDSLFPPPYNAYFKYQTVEYNKIIKKIAQENDIEYIDLYSPAKDMFKDSSMRAADSFHPSAKGYDFWAKIIYADFNN